MNLVQSEQYYETGLVIEKITLISQYQIAEPTSKNIQRSRRPKVCLALGDIAAVVMSTALIQSSSIS